MHKLEVLNPVAEQRGVVNSFTASPRPKSLDGLTVGLLWSGTHGGDVALNTAGELIQQRFKNVTVKFYNGNNYPAPEHIRKQCAEESDVVIGATAD
ncbi:MAG: hypothetical protein O3C10_12050 [Chloroflexi bacterium]|nr:hypothetical protein [Chloroflexota bacterium]